MISIIDYLIELDFHFKKKKIELDFHRKFIKCTLRVQSHSKSMDHVYNKF